MDPDQGVNAATASAARASDAPPGQSVGPSAAADVALEHARAEIAKAGTRACALFGLFGVIPSVAASWRNGVYGIVVGDAVIYISVLVVHFGPFNGRQRAAQLVVVMHAIGWMVLLYLGPLSHGVMWFVAGTVLAGMLLGARAARTSMVMQLVAIVATTVAFLAAPATWITGERHLFLAWVAFATCSMAMSLSLSAPLAALLDGLAKELVRVRRLEAQLVRAERLESLGTLASGIAHDFNNLVQPILVLSEVAAESLEPGHPVAEDMAEIRRAARNAADLVRQMMSLARGGVVVRAPIHLSPFVREQEPLLRASVPRNIHLHIETALADDLAEANATELQQVLVNLAVNASHAMGSAAGRLDISVRACVAVDVPPTAHDRGAGFMRIDVVDTGCGMDDATQMHIFEPFFTTKGPGVGTGLGLATVHRILSSMGGAVMVKSSVGIGSSFSLVLPRCAVSPAG